MSQVSFRNSYSTIMSVAYMRRDFTCRDECGAPWDVLGWVNLQPGEVKYRDNPTNNRWYYYYAEAADGAVWNGPFPAEVSSQRFEKCTCLGVIVQNGPPTSPYHTVGFAELDTNAHGGVNFTP
jgi:uncharacterized membrane protein